jgi:hypothetical protein
MSPTTVPHQATGTRTPPSAHRSVCDTTSACTSRRSALGQPRDDRDDHCWSADRTQYKLEGNGVMVGHSTTSGPGKGWHHHPLSPARATDPSQGSNPWPLSARGFTHLVLAPFTPQATRRATAAKALASRSSRRPFPRLASRRPQAPSLDHLKGGAHVDESSRKELRWVSVVWHVRLCR